MGRLNLHTILAATDFSGCADAAVDLALDVARRHGAELRLLHVREANGLSRKVFGGAHPLSLAWKKDLEDVGESDEVGMVWYDVPVIARMEKGVEATDAILEAVVRHRVDLLVLGTHGRHSVRRFLNDTPDAWSIGLTAREVLSETRCAVLAVGPRSDPEPLHTREVVAGMDDSPLAQSVLAHAAGLASAYDASLTAVHVTAPGAGPARRNDLERILGELGSEVVPGNVPFTVSVVEGQPATSLVRFVRHRPGGLLVVGSHGHRTRGTTRIGSVADVVVRSSSCPVLTVKPYGKSLVSTGDVRHPIATEISRQSGRDALSR